MRKLIFVLLFLLILLPTVGNTNSFYSDEKTILANTMSTGHWGALSAPVLISPANGSVTNPVGLMVMQWNGVSGASYYVYQDSRSGESGHLNSLFKILFIVPDGTSWWRVKACNSADVCSGWSDSWTVTMDGTQPLSVSMTVTGSWTKTVDEKITNGNFNSDLSGWTGAGDVAYDSSQALIGNTSGLGNNVWENRITQSFLAGAKTLSFDYNFFTTDGLGFDDPGFFARLNGQQIFSYSALSGDTGWRKFLYDLSSYADGTPLDLTLYAGNTGGPTNPSWVYIDKVTTTFVAAPKHAVFHLTGLDNPGGSGIDHFEYKIDSGLWTTGDTISGLTDLTEAAHSLYYRSVDNAGNYGDPSQTDIVIDDTAPSAITNLVAKTTGPNSVNLIWTAPGNDGVSGQASSYDIRYSKTPITDANFSGATEATNIPSPKESGQQESLDVLGLDPATQYYFAIKTSDAAPNVSALSNVASAITASGVLINDGDLIINELMWSGTGAGISDQFLEIRNMTGRIIDLSVLRLKRLDDAGAMVDMEISFVGKIITPNGYFLITNNHPGAAGTELKSTVIAGIESPNLLLSPTALEIELVDASDPDYDYVIDRAGDGYAPLAGDNVGTNHFSMERISAPENGGYPLDWYTCINEDSTTDFFTGSSDRGTPGAENRSVNEPIKANVFAPLVIDSTPSAQVSTPSAQIASPSATITNDGKNVSFKIINLGGFEKLSYTLTYDSDQAPQGIQGTAELQGVDFFEKTGILLGTCSTGGTCTYNTGVKNINLKVELTDSLGKITMLEGGEE